VTISDIPRRLAFPRRSWHSLDIKDGVLWVHGRLVLGRLSDETLLGGEGDEGWGGEATLLVGDCENNEVRCERNASPSMAQRTDFHAGALVVGDT
jgi:hypothetical protein